MSRVWQILRKRVLKDMRKKREKQNKPIFLSQKHRLPHVILTLFSILLSNCFISRIDKSKSTLMFTLHQHCRFHFSYHNICDNIESWLLEHTLYSSYTLLNVNQERRCSNRIYCRNLICGWILILPLYMHQIMKKKHWMLFIFVVGGGGGID